MKRLYDSSLTSVPSMTALTFLLILLNPPPIHSLYPAQTLTNQSVQVRSTAAFECSFFSNTSVYILWMFSPSLTYQQQPILNLPNSPHALPQDPYKTPLYPQLLPQPQVVLFTGENRFKAPPNMRVENIMNGAVVVGSRLVVEKVGVEDDGRYSCSVGGQNADQSASLNVLVPPGIVRIDKTSEKWREGNSVWLNCSTQGGNPYPRLEWRRNGEVMKEGWMTEETTGEGSERPRSAVLKEVMLADGMKFGRVSNNMFYSLSHRDHLSNFTCVALAQNSPSKTILSQASITIYVHFSPIISLGSLATLKVLEHSNFIINCSVLSFPIVSFRDVTWYYKESLIDTGFELAVKNVTRWSGGEYECRVGGNRKAVMVAVLYPPSISVNISLEQVIPSNDYDQSTSQQPYNSNNNNNNGINNLSSLPVTAVESQVVFMDCYCDANPPIKAGDINWKEEVDFRKTDQKTDKRLDQFPILSQSSGKRGPGSRLFFRPVSALDHGKYECVCSNYLEPYNLPSFNAYARKEVSLNVLYKPGKADIILPNIALVDKTSVLRCNAKVKGNPPCNYTWLREDKVIGNGSTLTLPRTLLSHSGLYTCVPSNAIGQGQNATTLFKVFESPTLLDPPLNNITLIEASLHQSVPIYLTCSVRASPTPLVAWFKDDVEIKHDLKIASEDDDNGAFDGDDERDAYSVMCVNQTIEEFSQNVTCVLKIEGSSEEQGRGRIGLKDAGVYKCVSSNDVAPAKEMKQVVVAVRFPPEVTSKPTQALEIGAEGIISFTIHSYPAPTVYWFNGSTSLDDNGKKVDENTTESGRENDFDGNRTKKDSDEDLQQDMQMNPQAGKKKYSTELTQTLPDTYLATLKILRVTTFDLQGYSIEVQNAVGKISSSVLVVAAEIPESPSNLNCTSVSWHTVGLSWQEGKNGGLLQQFLVEAEVVGGDSKTQTAVVNRTSVLFKGLKPSESYHLRVYAENKVGRSNASNQITVKLKELKINPPNRIFYSDLDGSVTISLPSTLHNLDPPYIDQNSEPRMGGSNDWGEFCARVDIYDGDKWVTEYPCVRELKVKLKGQEVKISAVRVSICSESRPDICSEEKYSSSDIVSTQAMIAVGCVCGLVVGVLLLAVLCLSAKRMREKKKHIKARVTVHSESSKEINNINSNNFWDSNHYTKATYNIDESPAVNGCLQSSSDHNDHINTNNNNNNYNSLNTVNHNNHINNNGINHIINNNGNNHISNNTYSSNGNVKYNCTPNPLVYNSNNIDLLSNNNSTNNLVVSNNHNNNTSRTSLFNSNNNNLNNNKTVSYISHNSHFNIPSNYNGNTFTASPNINHSNFNLNNCHHHHPHPHLHHHLTPHPLDTHRHPLSPNLHDLTPHFSPYISEDEHHSTIELIHSPISPSHIGSTFKDRAPSENKKKIIHEVIV